MPKSQLPGRFKGDDFSVGIFNPSGDHRNALEYLEYATRNMDAVILLVDSSLENMIAEVRNSFFTVILEVPHKIENLQNFLRQKLSKPLRNFSFLIEEMQDSDTEQVVILPLRNFVGNDLQTLARICRDDASKSTFSGNVTDQIALLKNRKQPRRKSDRPTIYIIDDDKKYFSYGKERHARLGTGAPHVIACVISGNFRFGRRIDSWRHYNVSCGSGDTTHISGSFLDCHNSQHEVKSSSHLNMFSNDFF